MSYFVKFFIYDNSKYRGIFLYAYFRSFEDSENVLMGVEFTDDVNFEDFKALVLQAK